MHKFVFRNSTYRTSGDLPAVGSRAPDLSLVATDLGERTLAHWMDKRKVLNIFPSIDTETSGRSVRAFDALGEAHDDVALLMISCDLPFAYLRFMKEHDVSRVVGLSAMRNAGFGENYGVDIVDGPLAGIFARAVVVLDENNTIVHHEFVENIDDEPDYGPAWQALGIDVDLDALEK